jgi:hypothetical protein
MECELVYKDMEHVLENRYLEYVDADQFSKIVYINALISKLS